jgi:DTW domain-containing protein YfiP
VQNKLQNISFCVHCTLPSDNCLCHLAPSLTLKANTHILFHPRELERRNSSGRLLKHCLNIPSTPWHRLKNEQLESQFEDYVLLYPADNKSSLTSDNFQQALNKDKTSVPRGYLWIDATWQESRKILNQSPWLHKLPKYAISAHSIYPSDSKTRPVSQYKLRRNQTENGLSTIETFSYWLYEQNQVKSAQDLLNFFNQFQTAFLVARNSGLFK